MRYSLVVQMSTPEPGNTYWSVAFSSEVLTFIAMVGCGLDRTGSRLLE